jgi:hypothetical protein
VDFRSHLSTLDSRRFILWRLKSRIEISMIFSNTEYVSAGVSAESSFFLFVFKANAVLSSNINDR